ncbi:MAG: molybdopterin-binding protein [Acidobacteriaceae bacterium]|nr:molybdopterin-binding protein [Acidobacteriaceae bacterium]MBV9223148.1 molybdopterin-binding protein [Acidobacteriaceae bacterium]MBV9306448.1 molybdopterin-binding protein [Acidobacteriaceae bacterium]
MRALTVDVQNSAGRILCCTIFRPGGRKLLAKGHVLNEEDVRLLETEGMREVWVTELEDGEVSEDDTVMAVAQAMCCGSVEIRLAAGGRANLIATEDCCTLIDDELLKQINCTSSIAIATVPNYKFVHAGERVATIKSAPFAVAQAQLETVLSILNERGEILQARPIREPGVAVLYTDPVQGDRARSLFEPIVRARIEKYKANLRYSLSSVEEEEQVARSLGHLLRTKPSIILVASTTAPAGPEDVIGRATARLGAHLERFLAPVEPGNLMMLSYKDDIPIVSAPCCHRSAKPNVLDLILPPILAKYRISGWEIAGLGHGGLLN